ncbi:hypothetical protein SSPO_037550 [Streptomyces antimycoticus]|uniref:Extracellular small neutral protease n=1 Tax=Streptomyces antimycoticus TaxID=68175 RepID=A0A499V4G7_9ACTN|nr:hypothetical protein SSPO_037550 [Streptomyces antimycoticus]
MSLPKLALSATLGLGLAAALSAVPASAATPDHSTTQRSAAAAGYTASGEEKADTDAFIKAVMKSALAKQAKAPRGTAAVTVTYDASQAPTFQAQISRSAQIWNSSVSNVKLQAGSNADFSYREGDDPGARTRAPTAMAAAMSSWTTPRTRSTTRPGSPRTRPATCWACRTTTRARAAS